MERDYSADAAASSGDCLEHQRLRAAAVHSHLLGLGALMRDPYAPMPAEVVARSIIETSLIAKWALDGDSPAVRVARALAVARNDARVEVKMAAALRDPNSRSPGLLPEFTSMTAESRDALAETQRLLQLPDVSLPRATALFQSGLSEAFREGG